jgi:tetratricopeptide (TPR) repeat protein
VTDRGYTLPEVSRLLGLSRSIITGLIDAGFVSPERGPRKAYRFTFQDLVLLRSARGLSESGLSSTRVLRALRRLKAQLPDQIPRAGLRIEAVGDAVVVSEGGQRWQPDDGQYVFGFAIEPSDTGIAVINTEPRDAVAPDPPANDWFAQAIAIEDTNPNAAIEWYRRAIEQDRGHIAAYVNLGRVLQDRDRAAEAEAVYREALRHDARDATLLFNLGVLLHDSGRTSAAIAAYRAALESDPEFADAHYNLALVYEATGATRDALRHYNAYRKFSADPDR